MSRANENWLYIGGLLLAFLLTYNPSVLMKFHWVDIAVDIAGFIVAIIGLEIRIAARDWKLNNGGKCLVTSGPYSIVRHPMYLGSFLAGFGICMIIGSIPFLLIYTASFLFVHIRIARREEASLNKKWPAEFETYKKEVNIIIPTLQGSMRLLVSSRQWVESYKNAFLREHAAVFGVMAGACLSEAFSDITLEGWAETRLEASIFIGIALMMMALWLTIRKLEPVLADAKQDIR